MVQHYRSRWRKTVEMSQVHFWHSAGFLNELGQVWPEAKSCVCLHKSRPRVCGSPRCLSWAQRKHRRCMGHCVRQGGPRMTRSHCKHSQRVRDAARACVCAHVRASAHVCPSKAAVRYKYGATPWVNAHCLVFTGMSTPAPALAFDVSSKFAQKGRKVNS